ncbi:histone H1-like [Hypanus sabinus]|uniref:histone H1-like n=1 Tax=Hypanus sabinus TaxID=79690 RepID=UPI0028C48C5D|nr:histone H1-like [Hypanus sabinus]
MTETAAAEVAPPAEPAAATKAPKKKKTTARTKTAGPKLGEQIDKIVADCRSHRGVSIVAIKKELAANGVDVEKLKSQIKMVIKRKLESGSLVHTKGAGASGSLKAAKKDSTAKIVKKTKKPAGKKSQIKKPAIKKTASKKAAKKSPAKKQSVKKPTAKKAAAKKPAAKKAAQKPKSPKKVAAPKAKAPKKSAKPKPKAKSVKARKTAAKK